MANGCARRVVLGCGFLVAIWPGTGYSVEKDPLLATVDKPAVITARRGISASAAPHTRLQTIVSITSYHPLRRPDAGRDRRRRTGRRWPGPRGRPLRDHSGPRIRG
jgi:hypothetical protein